MFVAGQGSANRFSLLLLNEGEYYFEDYAAVFYPTAANDADSFKQKQKGRLKLCSDSLMFEPENTRFAIMKFPFDSVVGCGKWSGELAKKIEMHASKKPELFVLRTEVTVQMKKNNLNHPYTFIKDTGQYRFSLLFETLMNFLPKMQNLLRISQLHLGEKEKQLTALIEERERSILFNNTWLVNLGEKSQAQLSGMKVTPLVNNPGRILLTNARLYFQPLNNVGARVVEKYELANITQILTRRHALRHVGLEVFFTTGESLYLSFKTQAMRDELYQTIKAQAVTPDLSTNTLELMTYKWRNRMLSNFEYLMYLNTLAHRSFNDITQYPVFPWVIADYTSPTLDLGNPATYRDLSKPVGALNPGRLESLKVRFEHMAGIPDQPPFLYGTHYSTPGYVLYYLVRKAPEYMLRLQNGRFDSPDRLFTSIAESWQGVMVNPSDVKELIPEFYMEDSGDFLVNSEGLNFGTRQNGEVVNDVVLPPWANSPQDFVRKSREVLESDHVSEHLHKWIDLIFGFAQRGEEAVKHDNVFYYMTYEGAVDIEAVQDPTERRSIEAQINEFGQTPHQLFTVPHPPRLPQGAETEPMPTSTVPASVQRNSAPQLHANPDGTGSEHSTKKVEKASPPRVLYSYVPNLQTSISSKLHREAVTGVAMSKDQSTIFTVSQDSFLKVYSIESQKQLRNISMSNLALSACQLARTEDIIFLSSWDNQIYTYSIDYGRVLTSVYAHDDAVSCMRLQGSRLISGSWDSTVKLWDVTPASIENLPVFDFIENETEVKCVDLSYDGNIGVSGSSDGALMLFDVRNPSSHAMTHPHRQCMNDIVLVPDASKIITCSKDNTVMVLDRSTCGEICSFEIGEEPTAVRTDGSKVLVGTRSGVVRVWDIASAQELTTLEDIVQPQQDISCMHVANNGTSMVTGSTDGSVAVWQ